MPIKIDRNKIFRTYREYLEKLKSMGEMREIDEGVDWNLEEGAILRRAYEECLPGPIFNKIKGRLDGFRAACFGDAKSGTPGEPWRRTAVMLGLPPEPEPRPCFRTLGYFIAISFLLHSKYRSKETGTKPGQDHNRFSSDSAA